MSSYSLPELADRLAIARGTAADHRDVVIMLQSIAADRTAASGVRDGVRCALVRWTAARSHERGGAIAELRARVASLQRLAGDPASPPVAPVTTEADSCNEGPAAAPPAATATPLVDASLPPGVDPMLLREFICEGQEQLQQAEVALLALEQAPDDAEAVNTVFRAFHTIKGTAASLALDAIAECAHHAESILSRVRGREIRCTVGYADLVLRALDMIRTLLDVMQDAVDGRERPLPPTYRILIAELRDPDATGTSDALSPTGIAATSAASRDAAADHPRAGVPPQREPVGESTVRVRTAALERLTELADELLVTGTSLVPDPAGCAEGDDVRSHTAAAVARIARELQSLSVSMRTVPLTASFQKVARLVRDLGNRSGKHIAFVTHGEATAIDRSMVDLLADPLLHMARNAVDHGIESSSERRAAGKPEQGTVSLTARRVGGQLVVELRDDGRGLDRTRIVQHALHLGLIATADGLADAELHDLIFTPGLSTAETITDVSGRGVGMDVVRRNIQALRGRIDIHTQAGVGTTFRVTLPQTLASTCGTLVAVGAGRFIVPTAHVHLSVRAAGTTMGTASGTGELALVQDEVLPLMRLHRLFGADGAIEDPASGVVLVVGTGGERVALLVDELLGDHRFIARPGNDDAADGPAVAGMAVLPEGEAGVILDVKALIELARNGAGAEACRALGGSASRAVA